MNKDMSKASLFQKIDFLEQTISENTKRKIKTFRNSSASLETYWNKEGIELVNLDFNFKGIDFALAVKILEAMEPYLKHPHKQLEIPFEVEVKEIGKGQTIKWKIDHKT